MEPYLSLLNDWLEKATLESDLHDEFFVTPNSSVQAEMTARDHWQKAFVVRSVNLS